MGKRIQVILLAFGWLAAFGVAPTLVQRSEASPALERLVAGARKEGKLDLTVTSSQGEKGSRELIDTFKRRFGLDIKINVDLSGQESQKFNQAIAETKNRIPPTFDLIEGTAENILALKEAGGAEMIDDWEQLLAEIAPEAFKVKNKVSPTAISGYGFLRGTRTVVLLYNPKIIPERDLPRTWKEMGDRKYAGAFSVPPWISHAMMGLLKYDKEEWLEIVKFWGKNKRDVLTYSAGVERMLLGDLKFLYGNDHYYYEQKARDPNAPIAIFFFDDLTPDSEVMYVIRKDTRNANAAKLFALWATSSEANLVYEKYSFLPNLALGTGPISKEMIKALKARNIKPVGWFEDPQNLKKFLWLKTEEGQKYQKAIASAHRTGR